MDNLTLTTQDLQFDRHAKHDVPFNT